MLDRATRFDYETGNILRAVENSAQLTHSRRRGCITEPDQKRGVREPKFGLQGWNPTSSHGGGHKGRLKHNLKLSKSINESDMLDEIIMNSFVMFRELTSPRN